MLAAAAVAALGAPPAVARAPSPMVGIADQKPDFFTDARYLAFPSRIARLDVGWDALDDPLQTRTVDRWLSAALTAGVEPLITFDRSNIVANHDLQPSTAQFRAMFVRWRERYPWVTTYATWNEANHSHLTRVHPGIVARYWNAISAECQKCRILAAELLDTPHMAEWARSFRRVADREPRYWGLHNYVDVNRLRTTGTHALLRATRGQVWLTETGGLVSRTSRSRVPFPESVAHAAIATRWLFDRLVPISRRITRVYIYHWNQGAGPGPPPWDSGLIGPTNRARPAYAIVLARARTYARRAAGL